MNIPENLRYSEEHEWLKQEGDIVIVGITDYAQKELGDIVFVDVTTVDEELSAGDVFGTLEAVKTVADLYMPVSGVVVELNEKLADEPELINNDPYGDGWIVKVKPADLTEVDNLLTAEQYKERTEG